MQHVVIDYAIEGTCLLKFAHLLLVLSWHHRALQLIYVACWRWYQIGTNFFIVDKQQVLKSVWLGLKMSQREINKSLLLLLIIILLLEIQGKLVFIKVSMKYLEMINGLIIRYVWIYMQWNVKSG